MSVKLFDADSHQQVFEGTVVSCEWDEKRKAYGVILDQTAFFAEGGGQMADGGKLFVQREEGELTLNVEHVAEKGEDAVHYVAEALEAGTKVRGEIDWEARFDRMQQHSGEHIYSGLVYRAKGYHNVGFHLGDAVTRLDFDGPLSEEEIRAFEEEANRLIAQNLPVRVVYPEKAVLDEMDYRSKKELSGAVRIVLIGEEGAEVDCCACCAPHVKTTGEIGLLKIIHAENYKGGVRLLMVCGSRALADYQKKQETLGNLAQSMSTSEDKVAASVAKLTEERNKLAEKTVQLSKELIRFRAEELLSHASISTKTGGRVLIWSEELLDQKATRELVNLLVEKTRGEANTVIAAMMPNADGSAFLLAASGNVNMKTLGDQLRKEKGFKGGGSPAMIQGTIYISNSELSASLADFL